MFGNLFGKKEIQRFTDKTFLSTGSKHAAIVAICKQDANAVFMCWFADTYNDLQKLFAAEGIGENHAKLYRQYHPSSSHQIYFAEHYPLSQKEKDVVANWQQPTFTVFNALDEPLFKSFGSEKIIPLAQALGVKPDEAFEHTYITNSIAKAQKKIAEKVTMEHTAQSQEEWMRINFIKD